MPRKQRSELLAGIFIVAALAILLGVVIWLGASDIFRSVQRKAYFYIKEGGDASGLDVGSDVNIAGIKIGTIGEKYLDPKAGRAYYVAHIEQENIQIHSDGVAGVIAGLVGESSLSVKRGGESEPLADSEGSAIEITGGLFTALGAAAEKINSELDPSNEKGLLVVVKKTMANLERETNAGVAASLIAKVHTGIGKLNEAIADLRKQFDVSDPNTILANILAATASLRTETSREAGSMVAKVHGIVDDVQEVTSKIKPDVIKTASNLAQISEDVKKYVQKDIADILAQIGEASTSILKISKDMAVVSGEVREMVLINRENLDEMIDNMAIVSANLKATSKEVRRAPWRLLYTPDEKELAKQDLYDAARAFQGGAEQLDQALSKLKGIAAAYPKGIDPKDPKVQEIRKQVLESFEQFKKFEEALWKELK